MATPLAEGTISVYKYRNSVVGFLLYLSLSLCSYTLAKPSSFYISYRYNLYGLLSAVAVRFFRCKGRLPRLIRRLEVHFLQILPSTKSNWQEKPSYEAVPAAAPGSCIWSAVRAVRDRIHGKGVTFPSYASRNHSLRCFSPVLPVIMR